MNNQGFSLKCHPSLPPALNGRQRRMTFYTVKVDASVEAYSYWVTETLILPDITKTECNSCFNAGDKRSAQTILGRQYFIHCITLNILVIEIPVLYQPCVAGGRQLPARALVLSARSVLTCIAHECMIAPPAFSKVLMLHFSMNAETLEVEKERWSFEGHATMFVCFENT